MKIFRLDLQKVKDNIKNKIEGYPVVVRRTVYRRVHFVNCSETFEHLCGFQETR